MLDILKISPDLKNKVENYIIGSSMYADNISEFYDIAEKYSFCSDSNILGLIVLGLGHSSRVHKDIQLDRVALIINNIQKTVNTLGYSEDEMNDILPRFEIALSDIEFFIGENEKKKIMSMVPLNWYPNGGAVNTRTSSKNRRSRSQ